MNRIRFVLAMGSALLWPIGLVLLTAVEPAIDSDQFGIAVMSCVPFLVSSTVLCLCGNEAEQACTQLSKVFKIEID